MTHRPRALVIAAAVLGCAAVLGGCVEQRTPSADAGPPKELGERAVFETTTTTSTTPGGATPVGSSGATTTTSATSAGRVTTTTTAPRGAAGGTTATTAPAKPLGGSVTDGRDDNGLGAPDYADLATVALEDTGTEIRATVTFTAGVPRTLADGEVMGVGVDLFRTNDKESDYQLYATGRVDGWTAYLDTPEGFVKYPGTFTVTGPSLVFAVPWSAIGGHVAARFSSFADWSKAAAAVIAQEGQDSAPDQGTAPLASA